MPIISTFFGIVVRMYYHDHEPAHFHAEYRGQSATFDLAGRYLRGQLESGTARRLISDWATLHRRELEQNWVNMKEGRPLERVPPLE